MRTSSATCGQCYGAAFDIPYEALDCTKFKVAILEQYPGGNEHAIQLPGSGAYSHFLCEFGYATKTEFIRVVNLCGLAQLVCQTSKSFDTSYTVRDQSKDPFRDNSNAYQRWWRSRCQRYNRCCLDHNLYDLQDANFS